MKKSIKISVSIIMAGFCISACEKVLDKENLRAVNPSAVWSNATLATAYMNDIYNTLMPGNPYGTGNGTDEGIAYERQSNAWLAGTATEETLTKVFDQYTSIRTVNIFLKNIALSTFDDATRNPLKGEGLFWRAWTYHSLVKNFGGVPLILEPQEPTTDLTALQVPRSKTSECVAQILKDLDEAISLLPNSWTGENVGRIDKGTAMAFKGRVLLFYASPLFNGLGGVASWQKAYDANKTAKDFLTAQGKGLYPTYSKIWDDELNKEVVMVRRYNYPQANYFQGGLIPLNWSKDDVGSDRPSLELVNAFPMKDGSAWTSGARLYDTLFRSRDDRFYANIYYNGSPNQYLAGMKASNTYLWTYFDKITAYNSTTGIAGQHNQVTTDPLWSGSSFYRIKAIDKTILSGTVYNAAVDWPEIRFAEVLMNFGECANETGNTAEALDVLKQIRQRAGILAGPSGNYGLTAATQTDLRTAYQNERFVEFCFEGKRWDDLRRWKMFGYLRSLKQRHGLAIELKPGETDVQPLSDINTVYTKFKSTVVETDYADIVIPDKFYFYGLPKTLRDRNPLLKQNNNWVGDFDPLQ